VTYARLHILTLVVSFYCDISYISFIILFMILVIQLSSIYNFTHVIIVYTLFICTDTFPSFFTHSLDHFLMILDLHVQILDVLFH